MKKAYENNRTLSKEIIYALWKFQKEKRDGKSI